MTTKNKSRKAEYQAKWYRKHAAEQKARVRARNDKVITENQERVYSYLEIHPCIDCGETNPIVLDFDHDNPEDKKESVSVLIARGHSWSMVEREMAKCSVKCGNCHRIKTSKDGNYIRYKIWCGRQVSNLPASA